MYLVLALAFSSCLLVVGASLTTSLSTNVERGVKCNLSGDLMVVDALNRPLQFTGEVPVGFVPIGNSPSAITIILGDPDVATVAPRTIASGVIVAGAFTAPAMLIGIDPEAEPNALRHLPSGTREALGKPRAILLGSGMAERLRRAGAEGTISALIPTPDGLFAGDAFEVAGPFNLPGLPLVAEFVAFLPLRNLEALLFEEGHPRCLVVRLREGADVSVVQNRVRNALRRESLNLQVWTWEDTAGDLLGIARVSRFVIYTGFLCVLMVVTFGVSNMLLILMLEKTREIGLMRALGTERVAIVAGLLAEAAFVSVLAAAVGAVLGWFLCKVLGHVGIPAISRAMTYAFGGERFYPEIHGRELLFGVLVVGLVGPVAALRPALRASASAPMDVMRNPA